MKDAHKKMLIIGGGFGGIGAGVWDGYCDVSQIFGTFVLSCHCGERLHYFLAEIRLARSVICVHQKRR